MLMHFRKYLPLFLLLFAVQHATAQKKDYATRVADYIAQYRELAIAEQQRTGIPAAIKLAQGIHETAAGNSRLAVLANNHFGIKCKKDWKGETFAHTDDAPNECFRKYSHPNDSYKNHSDYLRNNTRYSSLFTIPVTDYAAWAIALKKCGYATNSRYAHILIRIIEDYNLQQYTYAAVSDELPASKDEKHIASEVIPDKDAAPVTERSQPAHAHQGNTTEQDIKKSEKPPYGQLVRVNGLRAFYAQKGSSLLQDAEKHKIRYAKLLSINDLPDEPLEADMFIYLDKKHSKGTTALHVVKPGETLLQAAQYEGMQLKALRNNNKLVKGEEPAPGALLYLQDPAPRKPELTNDYKSGDKLQFAGSSPSAVPRGTGRTRASYISKAEIEQYQTPPVTATPPPPPKPVAVPSQPPPPIQNKTADIPVRPAVVDKEETVAAVVNTKKVTPTPQEPEQQQPVAITPPPPPVAKEVVAPPEKPVAAPNPVEENIAVRERKTPAPEEANVPQPAVRRPDRAVNNEVAPKAITAAQPKPAPPPRRSSPNPIREPKDEYDRLKMKLDRVVYANHATSSSIPATSSPVTATTPTQAATPPPPVQASSVPAAALYTVREGDTAFSIAREHNITMRQLMEWNNLDFEELKVGQKLRVR